MIRVVEEGIVFPGVPNSRTANCCFPGLLVLKDGTVLANWAVGLRKGAPDSTVWLSRSADRGKTWSSPTEPFPTRFEGAPGNLLVSKLTDLGEGHLLAALMWFDRTNHPTSTYFNPETGGLLPVRVLFSESHDNGSKWGPLWAMDDRPYVTRCGMTGPVLVMPDGRWACPFEVNKSYDDPSPWRHIAALKLSTDEGRSWSDPVEIAADPDLRVLYADQRLALAPDGTCLAAFWTLDSVETNDLNITLSESHDNGLTWSPPRDTGLAGQLPYPIFLSDGRLVLLYIDRYGTKTIRARISHDKGRTFEAADAVIHTQRRGETDPGFHAQHVAEHLQQEIRWTFGFASGVVGRNGEIWTIYYAGDLKSTAIHWSRLAV